MLSSVQSLSLVQLFATPLIAACQASVSITNSQSSLKLLQHHSSKASILWHSVFFTVQLSHPYMTTGKTIALTRRTFVGSHVSVFQYAI